MPLQKIKDCLTCPICKEYFVTPMSLLCSHVFCSLCIRESLSSHLNCPSCRTPSQGVLDLRNERVLEELLTHFKILESCSSTLSATPSTTTSTTTNTKRPIHPSSNQEIKKCKLDFQVKENQESMVECPICSSIVDMKLINKHIDNGCQDITKFSLTGAFAKLKSKNDSVGLKGATKGYKASLSYSLYNDSQLRKLLSQDRIPTNGDRHTLIKRHKHYIHLFNANLDSLRPVSTDELVRQLRNWESSISSRQSNSSEKWNDEKITKHLETYKDEFDRLIYELKEKKKLNKENVD